MEPAELNNTSPDGKIQARSKDTGNKKKNTILVWSSKLFGSKWPFRTHGCDELAPKIICNVTKDRAAFTTADAVVFDAFQSDIPEKAFGEQIYIFYYLDMPSRSRLINLTYMYHDGPTTDVQKSVAEMVKQISPRPIRFPMMSIVCHFDCDAGKDTTKHEMFERLCLPSSVNIKRASSSNIIDTKSELECAIGR